MVEVKQLSSGTWLISLPFRGESGIIGTYLLADAHEIALIDPGPGSTSEALLEGIRQAGFDPAEVTHLIATHIHLDHAGAIGVLAQHMPNAQVYVHSNGVPHLIDPSRLIMSAQRIYGEQMQPLWGEIQAVPAERVHTIEEGEALRVAGQRLEVHYAPGHAIHHVIFFNVHTGELYTGDTAGVRLQGIDYVRPPTPPPDLDLEDWSATLDKIKRLRPDVLYLAHFGPARNPVRHCEQLRERLFTWGDFVLQALRAGHDEAQIIEQFIARNEPDLRSVTHNEATLTRYEIATNYAMTVRGYIRYWKKKHPERL